MIEVKRYTDTDAELWNKFNAEVKIHYLCSIEIIWITTEIDFRIIR